MSLASTNLPNRWATLANAVKTGSYKKSLGNKEQKIDSEAMFTAAQATPLTHDSSFSVSIDQAKTFYNALNDAVRSGYLRHEAKDQFGFFIGIIQIKYPTILESVEPLKDHVNFLEYAYVKDHTSYTDSEGEGSTFQNFLDSSYAQSIRLMLAEIAEQNRTPYLVDAILAVAYTYATRTDKAALGPQAIQKDANAFKHSAELQKKFFELNIPELGLLKNLVRDTLNSV